MGGKLEKENSKRLSGAGVLPASAALKGAKQMRCDRFLIGIPKQNEEVFGQYGCSMKPINLKQAKEDITHLDKRHKPVIYELVEIKQMSDKKVIEEGRKKLLDYDVYLNRDSLLMKLKPEDKHKIIICCPNEQAMNDVEDILQALSLLRQPSASEKESHPFYVCEFCGCNTNAHLRRCCQKGYEADIIKSKIRAGLDKQTSASEGEIAEFVKKVKDKYFYAGNWPPENESVVPMERVHLSKALTYIEQLQAEPPKCPQPELAKLADFCRCKYWDEQQDIIDEQAKEIEKLKETMGYAIGGCDALAGCHKGVCRKDILAIKETLEQALKGEKEWK